MKQNYQREYTMLNHIIVQPDDIDFPDPVLTPIGKRQAARKTSELQERVLSYAQGLLTAGSGSLSAIASHLYFTASLKVVCQKLTPREYVEVICHYDKDLATIVKRTDIMTALRAKELLKPRAEDFPALRSFGVLQFPHEPELDEIRRRSNEAIYIGNALTLGLFVPHGWILHRYLQTKNAPLHYLLFDSSMQRYTVHDSFKELTSPDKTKEYSSIATIQQAEELTEGIRQIEEELRHALNVHLTMRFGACRDMLYKRLIKYSPAVVHPRDRSKVMEGLP